MTGFSWFWRVFRDPEYERKRQFLSRLPLFRGASRHDVALLFQALYPRTYRKGETLFGEGDIGRALFILESGKIELIKADAEGRPQTLAILEPGAYFGEMALLEERPRLASAVAAEETRVYMLYKAKLDSLCHHAPRIALAIMSHLAEILSARLRSTTEKLMQSRVRVEP